MIQKIILMLHIFKIINTQCTYDTQTYWENAQFSNDVFLVQENQFINIDQSFEFNKGLWINYRPMDDYIIENINNNAQSVNYLIYSLQKDWQQDEVFLTFFEFNMEDETILYHIYIREKTKQSDELLWQDYQFQINKYLLDQDWILFYYYIQNGILKIYLYSFSENNYQFQQITWNGDFSDLMYDYQGGQKDIIINGYTLNLNLFPGKFTQLFQTNVNVFDNLNYFLQSCKPEVICSSEMQTIIGNNQYFNGNYKVSGVSQYEISKNQFKISGWVKQDKFGFSQVKNQLLLRLSINQDYSNDGIIGNKLLYVIYHHNKDENLIGLEIHTYSYQIPYKSQSYVTPAELILTVFDKNYAELLSEWHFCQFEVGSNLNQGQPIYRIYFPNEVNFYQFHWNDEIHYFKNTKLYFHIGGDDIYKNKFEGQLNNWKLQTFCSEFEETLDFQCHYSCLTCKGTSNYDCLSCSTNNNRVYVEQANSCLCKNGFLEISENPVCKNYIEQFKTIQLINQEINCDIKGYYSCQQQNIQCEYGYFQYNKQCLKCPLNDNPNLLLDCVSCLLYPDQFASSLLCAEKYFSYAYDEIFNHDQKYLQERQLYQIKTTTDNNYYLQIVFATTNYSCKRGLYLDKNNNCQLCSDNCEFCFGPSIYQCSQCYKEYRKSENGPCIKCQNCDYCQSISNNNEEECRSAYFCKSLQYFHDNKCIDCGLYCQNCNKDGCLTCFNSLQYYIRLDRQSCGICSIQNCKYCFEYLYLDPFFYSSFDQINYFGVYEQHKIMIGCAECYPGYAFSLNTNTCQIQDVKECDSGIYDQEENFICLKSSILTTSLQNIDCSELENCYQCIKQYTYAIINFCIICQDGYYSEWQTGICKQCPEYCKICVQQHADQNDFWKSDLKAFYLYFLNPNKDNDFEYYGIISDSLQILCLECLNNFLLYKNACYIGCTDECLDCRIIEQLQSPPIISKCFKCKPNQYGLVRTLVNYQCQKCAPYCILCQTRSNQEIQQINSFFDITSIYYYYSMKCLLKSDTQNENINIIPNTLNVINCGEMKKCNKQILSFYNIYCNKILTNDPNDSQKRQSLTFYDTLILGGIQRWEDSSLMNLLNELSIQDFTYDLQMKCQEQCYQSAGFYSSIQTNLKTYTFYLRKVNLNIYSKSNLCSILISLPFYINNFNSILLKNLVFISSYYEQLSQQKVVNVLFQINNPHETLMITIDNCHFTQNKFDIPHFLSLTSNKPQNIQLLNLSLYNLKVQKSKVFDFQPNLDTTISTMVVHNFKLQDSEFVNTSIYYFNALDKNLNYELFFENVTILNTNFTINSFFINLEFENNFQIEKVEIKNIYLENVNINKNSSFIKLLSCKNLILKNLTMKNLFIQGNSAVILARNILINSITFENSFVNQSCFISNTQSNAQLLYQNDEIKKFEIYDIRFINNKYSHEKTFFKIVRLESENIFVNIQNLIFQNNNYFKLDYGTQQLNFISYRQALIYIECSFCYFQNIEITRGVGYPEMAIMKSNDLQIQNLTVEQEIEIHRKTRFLHSSFDCISKYHYLDLYFVIYIQQFHQVQLKQIFLQNLVGKDYPFIVFEGQSLTEEVRQGIIIIQDCIFQNNIQITTKLNIYSTIISIKTQQKTNIQFENVIFQNNWLNKYEDEIQIHSSTTLIIETFQGEILLKNTNFSSNIITNSSDSVIYIKTQNLTILNCHFNNQNNLNLNLIKRNILWDINQNNLELSLKYFFQTISQGGNGQLFVNSIKIIDSRINNSIALQGGGFYISTTSEGKIQILNSQFLNTQTNLNGYSISQGGLFYIDAQNSRLNFQMENSLIFRSYSRQEGGAILIIPSRIENYIYFNNVSFESSFSFKSSILFYNSNQLPTLSSQIIINNSRFQNNESEFYEYIKLIEDLSLQDVQTYQIYNPSISIQYSNFKLSNSIFYQIHLANLIKVTNVREILLENIIISNSNIFNSPLITLSLLKNFQGNLLINGLQIKKIIQYNYPSVQSCKSSKKEQLNKLICPITSLQIVFEPEIYLKQTDLTNQLNCNLNILYSKLTNNFALLQLTDFTSLHQININNLEILDSICKNCYYGLITIQQLEFQNINLKIDSLNIKDNICGQMGCLSIMNNFDSNVLDFSESSRILMQNNLSLLENFVDFNISTKLTNCLFFNNSASFGGGCFFANLNIYLDQCIFLKNTAYKSGGGIFFFSKNNKILLTNTKILNNTAQIAGGIYISQDQLNQNQNFNLLIKDNKAKQFADNIYEQPYKLYFSQKYNITQQNKIIHKNESTIIDQVIIQPYTYYGSQIKSKQLLFPSGIPIANYKYFDSNKNSYISNDLIFRISATNSINEKLQNLSGTSCQIYAQKVNSKLEQDYNNLNFDDKITSEYLSTNKKEFNMNTRDYNFDDLIIYFNPFQEESNYLQLAIQCKILQIPQYSGEFPFGIISIIKNYLLLLQIRTFHCQLGEYLNLQSGGCVECDISQNQYSVSFNASKCETKDEIKIKNIQPAMIELREGYWRPFYFSKIIEECYHLNLNCLGGWFAGNPSCAFGHIGALCEQCDLYNIAGNGQFSQSKKYSCSSCEDVAGNIVNILLVILWTLFSVFLSVNSTIKMIEEFIQYTKLKTIGKFIVFKSASTSVLIKVFTNYLQIISSLATFQLTIPSGITLTFTSVGNPIESMAFSLDCYLVQVSSIPIHYLRLIWGLLMVGFYIFAYMFIHLVSQVVINKLQPSITFIVTTLIYIYIYLSPNIFGGLISLLSYRNISNIDWISANVSYEYNTSLHYDWLVFFVTPIFIIIGIILPLFFWFVVYYNRSKLDTTKVRKIWGYLYNEYKVSTYYWETIKIIQKEFIILVLIYYEDYIAIKAILIFFILYIYGNLTYQYKPYQTGDLNHIDSLQTSICKISILLASLIFTAQSLQIREIILPSYVILAVINFAFTLNILSKILFAYFDKLQVQIDSVKAYFSYRFPYIIKSNKICVKVFKNTVERKQIIRQRFLMIKAYLLAEAKQIIQYKEFQKQISKTNRKMYDGGLYDNFSSSPQNINKIIRLNTNYNSSRFNIHIKQSSSEN